MQIDRVFDLPTGFAVLEKEFQQSREEKATTELAVQYLISLDIKASFDEEHTGNKGKWFVKLTSDLARASEDDDLILKAGLGNT